MPGFDVFYCFSVSFWEFNEKFVKITTRLEGVFLVNRRVNTITV